ncbi:4-hydroxyphenylpyruvate dioxygenase [Vibrio variabilis]|uniref:4-hydroxyphenylpyruvate dioxygenase n=1 Tax=Vibrio variabilis TaxID=990271 RepID=A0ABQ0JCP0_9VIBR|nr:4-hydroxyphenylpyruvate dioxygenase [Vibrio variabilis]
MTINFNPLGTDGFEFVEYTAATDDGINDLKRLFRLAGVCRNCQASFKRSLALSSRRYQLHC